MLLQSNPLCEQEAEVLIFIPNRTILTYTALATHQASLVEPWFFWRDTAGPKCTPWWDQTNLLCRSEPMEIRLTDKIFLASTYVSRFLTHSICSALILTILILCVFKMNPFWLKSLTTYLQHFPPCLSRWICENYRQTLPEVLDRFCGR